MKKNKKWIFLSLIIISLSLILIGTYQYIKKQDPETETKNNKLNKLVQKFNERNITSYFNGQNVSMKAKTSSSILYLYYVLGEKEISYSFELKNNILESIQPANEVMIGNLLDTILNLEKESAYSFLSVINNHTILDYSLEEDGLEFRKQENEYQVKIDLNKQLLVKDVFDVTIKAKDIKEQVLKVDYNKNIYYQKGYVIYKEEIDTKGNKVITFAQSKYCNIENLRQSIASYLEVEKGNNVKVKFLNEVSNETLEQENFTRDNYELNSSYLVFSEDIKDEYFDYYLSNNYRTVTLIINGK